MSNKEKTVVPKLRFSKFSNLSRWNIIKFGRLIEPVEERAGTKKYVLMSITSGVGLVPQTEKFGREIAGNAYKNYYVIKKNDFAYNKSATKQFPEGYISMLTDYEEAALPNSIFTCFRIINEECDPRYFNYLFQNNYHGKWLRKYIEVGARAHGSLSVDINHLWNMPVALPSSQEQQKIANCLSSLDDIISAEEKKLSLLKLQKIGLMQKLFPSDGKSIPEWRFQEFKNSGDWISDTIGNTCEAYSGGTPLTSKMEYYGGKIPFIRSAEINKETTELFLTKEGYENSAAKTVKSGDILVALYGANSGEVALSKINGAINQAVLCLKHKTDNAFVYQYLSYKKNWIIRTYIQGGQGNLSGEIIKSIELFFPTVKEEQRKIADCLSGIDDIITVQTQKIEKLRQHKKALIQGLFPSIWEVENESTAN